ncbi:uncharacterized protein UTRI_10094 [Ustilago trichophora]|uniref:C2H2-type domain-containing protein n=1 Tax=Ustilago trichophora TaxID=86804 RepID=A0A5C3E3M1_9BASI|nr:uncharacterized protein UTRI_10094 [Ustilago trichophora]
MSQVSVSFVGASTSSRNSPEAEVDSAAQADSCSLPPANQDVATPPLDPQLIAQLGTFQLRLAEHPRVLICTRSPCTYNVPITPTTKAILDHLLKYHEHNPSTVGKKMLRKLVDDLNLEPLASVYINMDLLPAKTIKELPVLHGYCCTRCAYTIWAISAMQAHVRTHSEEADGKAKYIHPVPMQVIYKSGKMLRYLHVRNQDLEFTPPPPLLTSAAKEDDAIQAKVQMLLQQDKERMEEAGLKKPGIQPDVFGGNIGPWAKQLGWQTYWAGKPVVAIGALGTKEPQAWPGAHSDFVHWLFFMAKPAVLSWMEGLTAAGRQVQQTFCAYDANCSQPYDLSAPTLKKRADQWAKLLALLAHIFFDGESLGYFGKSTEEEHIGINADMEADLLELQDQHSMLANNNDRDGIDMFKDATVVAKARKHIITLTLALLGQKAEVYGQNGKLTLVRLFLHACVSRDGTPKMLTTCTSIIAGYMTVWS